MPFESRDTSDTGCLAQAPAVARGWLMRRMPTAGVRPLWLSVGSRHAPVQAVAPARLDHDGSRQRHQPLQIGQLVDAKTRRRFVSFLQAIDQYWSHL